MKIFATSIACLLISACICFAQESTATAATEATSPATSSSTKKQPVAEAKNPTSNTAIPAAGAQVAIPPVSTTAAVQSETPVTPVSNSTAAPVDSAMKADVDKKPAIAPKAAAVVEESEEDLFLDGGEESIIAPAPIPIVKQKQTVTADSSSGGVSVSSDSSQLKKDSVSTEGQAAVTAVPPVSPIPLAPEEPAAPARIEKLQSINFAKNFREYRSPKIAILLSLLLPGTGQAYAHNKLKTGIYGAVEVALITTGAILAYKGSQKTKVAHHFADSLYDTTLFMNYYKSLKTNIIDVNTADSQIFMTFGDPDTFILSARDRKNNKDFYSVIGNEASPFVQGWKDARPRVDAEFRLIDDEDGAYFFNEDTTYLIHHVNENGDTSNAMFGFSDNQRTYQRKLSNAKAYYGWSQTMFALLVANHIISAIDAGITAKAYNDQLLGKSSLWQKINIRDNFVRTPAGTAQGYALEVRF